MVATAILLEIFYGTDILQTHEIVEECHIGVLHRNCKLTWATIKGEYNYTNK